MARQVPASRTDTSMVARKRDAKVIVVAIYVAWGGHLHIVSGVGSVHRRAPVIEQTVGTIGSRIVHVPVRHLRAIR